MASRLTLHDKFLELTANVYYQAPPSMEMQYPCIRYKESKWDTKYANNKAYIKTKGYQVIIIDEDPDSTIPDRLSDFPMCEFDRTYVVDDLNHWVFNLYF